MKINAFGAGQALPQPDVWEGAFDEAFFVERSEPVRYQPLIGPSLMFEILVGPPIEPHVLEGPPIEPHVLEG